MARARARARARACFSLLPRFHSFPLSPNSSLSFFFNLWGPQGLAFSVTCYTRIYVHKWKYINRAGFPQVNISILSFLRAKFCIFNLENDKIRSLKKL